MIPYDELVSALAEWRARQGLGAAPAPARTSARIPAAATPPAGTPAFAPPAPVLPGRATGYSTGPAAAVAAAVVVNARPVDDFDNVEGTEIRDEGLGDEIDVDAEAVDVIEEEHLEE